MLGDTLQQDLLRVLLPLQRYEVHLVQAQSLVHLPGDAADVGLGGVPQPVPGEESKCGRDSSTSREAKGKDRNLRGVGLQ